MKENAVREWWLILLAHVVCWLIFIQLIFDIKGLFYSLLVMFVEEERHFDEAFLFLPLMGLFFYTNAFFLIPRYLSRNLRWHYLGFLVLLFLTTLMLALVLGNLIFYFGWEMDLSSRDIIDYFGIILFVALATSSGYGIVRMHVKERRRAQEIENQNLRSELQLLKAQIQPHFLFNSLNTIYSLAQDESATQAAEAVLKLSGMVRFMLKDSEQDMILLEQEIDLVRNYVDLQMLRVGDNVPVKLEIDGNTANRRIAPLLFIPFVENAFKHGVSYKDPHQISIRIGCRPDSTRLDVTNKIYQQSERIGESSHIGLSNVKRRLELLYHNRHTLNMVEEGGMFRVSVSLMHDEP